MQYSSVMIFSKLQWWFVDCTCNIVVRLQLCLSLFMMLGRIEKEYLISLLRQIHDCLGLLCRTVELVIQSCCVVCCAMVFHVTEANFLYNFKRVIVTCDNFNVTVYSDVTMMFHNFMYIYLISGGCSL